MFSGGLKGKSEKKRKKIQNCRSHTKLFDKGDNFTFNIIRMPNNSSNISREIICLAMFAEILRIAKQQLNFIPGLLKICRILTIVKQRSLINDMKTALFIITRNVSLKLKN